jgi:hypothetical protein
LFNKTKTIKFKSGNNIVNNQEQTAVTPKEMADHLDAVEA